MPVLVTGASGFTGSNLCRRLVEAGCEVRALVRPTSKREALADLDLEIVTGDLAGDSLPADLCKNVDTVYHIAAMYREQGTEKAFQQVNASGTDRLLYAALDAGVRRFVHCSTVGVLGNIENPPANEDAPYAPGDRYQKSKLEGELRALSFMREHGLPVTVVRPSAIYGPGDLRFVKLFRAINRRMFVMLGSGEVYYHYVYIDDLVAGFMLAAASDAAVGEVFIIAGAEFVTIKRLTEMIAEALGRPAPALHFPIAPVMFAAQACQAICEPLSIKPPLYPRRLDFFRKHRAFDISKARRILGYQPQVDMRTGIQRTADWYRSRNLL